MKKLMQCYMKIKKTIVTPKNSKHFEKLFILSVSFTVFGVTIVLYFIKILSGSRSYMKRSLFDG